MTRHRARKAFLLLASTVLWGCSDSGPTLGAPPPDEGEFPCIVPVDSLFDGGVGRDGIRALVDPPLVRPDDPDASYVQPEDRVVGIRAADGYVAVPHNILFRHETVNLEVDGHPIAVTYCPLTGSYAVFDREPVGGVDLGISGVLFRSNLVVFDRREDRSQESIWSQMDGRSICGQARGRTLAFWPAIEMTWEGWKRLHPETQVISSQTGFPITYDQTMNVIYEQQDNPDLFVPVPRLDTSRPPKERVLGIRIAGDGGVAFPFGALSGAPRRVISQATPQGPVVVFWETAAQGGGVYFSTVDGMNLDFEVSGNGWVDEQTGSLWNLAGQAVEGPLAGAQMELFPDYYTAFWFAWALFQPQAFIWVPGTDG